MKKLQGISASPGLVMGPIYRLRHGIAGLTRVVELPIHEQALFDAAVILAKDEILQMEEKNDGPQRDILMFQRVMLEDYSLLEQIKECIAQGMGAARAVEHVGKEYAAMIEAIDDEYLSQRSIDVLDVCRRVVKILDGESRMPPQIEHPSILVSDRIYPSDLIGIDKSKILGIATSAGSVQSHAAIMARIMGIPSIIQLGADILNCDDRQFIILDAYHAQVTLNPNEQAIEQAQMHMVHQDRSRNLLLGLKHQPCITKDGTSVTLFANCSSAQDVRQAIELGADGVGLLRSEFLIAGDHVPGEEEQYLHYRQCLSVAEGKPITVCTFDIGEDRKLEGLDDPIHYSALGLRGIRFQLAHPNLFLNQIRALLRAAVYGNLRVIFPLITSPADWEEALELVDLAKRQLRQEGVPFCDEVPIGAMIEVPSAALLADEILGNRCDFVNIGTNDLIQYTYAADRQDSRMSSYFTGWPRAVSRLIDMVVQAARYYKIPVYACGVNASDPDTAERYIWQGVTGLSLESGCLMQIKAHLLDVDLVPRS